MEVPEKEKANKLDDYKVHIKDGMFLRPATHADYQAVVDIDSKLNDGFDYLPYVYHRFINQSNRYCNVLEKDGKVAGFGSYQIIDGGVSMLGQGARGSNLHRGHGVFQSMRDAQIDMILKEKTDVMYDYGSQVNPEGTMKAHKDGKIYSQLIMCRPQIPLKIDVTQKNDITSMNPAHMDIISLSRERSMEALMDMDVQMRLFPHGYIYIGWEPYKIMQTNFKYVIASEFYATTQNNGHQTFASLSFGTYFILERGLFYILDYYGDNEWDAIAHVQRHLSEAIWRQYKQGEVYIVVHVPATMDYFNLVKMIYGKFAMLGVTVTKYDKMKRRHFSRRDFTRDNSKVKAKY